jgi:D-arginine dehydrogenase
MAESADVVVIGAGFAGAATAFHLARRGIANVVILEQEARPGLHASGKNAALVFQLMEQVDEARLAVEGLGFYAEPPDGFSERPLLRSCGSILVAGEAGRASLEEAERDAKRLGIPAHFVSRDHVVRRVPLLRESEFVVALENSTDAIVDIAALLNGYLDSSRRAGARLELGEPVVEIRRAHGRIEAVVTPKRTIHTHAVVNAAGPWAGKIGKLARVGDRTIAPRRRHLYEAEARVAIDPSWPFVWNADLDVYFRPEGRGLLMSPCDASAHLPVEPALDPATERLLEDKLRAAFPALLPITVISARACLRTFAANCRFLIGPDPDLAGLVWVAALGGHGMSTSYGVGRLGAMAALGETSPELEGFAPARLAARRSPEGNADVR